MSFETGTATSVGDLLVKWFNFLQTNGWTADLDFATAGQSPAYGIINRQDSKSGASPIDSDLTNYVNLYCGFAVGDSDTNGDHLMMIPMRDYSSGAPQNAVEVATSTLAYNSLASRSHLKTNFPTTPFETYWFFESDFYAHAVVEVSSGIFRHFGMGSLSKVGKWQGGEYYYGSFWNQSGSFIENALYNGHTVGLDANPNLANFTARIYGKLLDGQAFPDLQGRQSPESAWHCFSAIGESGGGVTFDADNRDVGALTGMGPRYGAHHTLFQNGFSKFNGFRPMYPIFVNTWYTASNPDNMYPLGFQPDVRSISMEGSLLPGDEFTIGTDTWVAFPVARRREIKVFDDTEYSGFLGLAYKKVTT